MKHKTWDSIDEMPVYNWFKINETNDLSFILKEPIKNWRKYEDELRIKWDNLLCEFVDTFGISDKFKRILRLHGEIAIAKCDVVLEGDRSRLTDIEIYEYELKQLTQDEPKQNLDKMSVEIERHMGFRINKKEVTVKEYYTYLNAFVEDLNNKNGQK